MKILDCCRGMRPIFSGAGNRQPSQIPIRISAALQFYLRMAKRAFSLVLKSNAFLFLPRKRHFFLKAKHWFPRKSVPIPRPAFSWCESWEKTRKVLNILLEQHIQTSFGAVTIFPFPWTFVFSGRTIKSSSAHGRLRHLFQEGLPAHSAGSKAI